MEFIVSRTSLSRHQKPCNEAVKKMIPYWHIRTCSIKYFNEHFAGRDEDFFSKGKNHIEFSSPDETGIETLWCARQEDDREKWVIEIKDLLDLNRFISQYGEIIIQDYKYDDPKKANKILEIEIYDDYRE